MGKGIKARVDARVVQPDGVYGPLSRAAHGDARAVLSLVNASVGDQAVEWGPSFTTRIPEVLRSYAVGARDFAVLLEQVSETEHPEVQQLDDILVANVPGFSTDEDWSSKSGVGRPGEGA
jgi:hypothetical protein